MPQKNLGQKVSLPQAPYARFSAISRRAQPLLSLSALTGYRHYRTHRHGQASTTQQVSGRARVLRADGCRCHRGVAGLGWRRDAALHTGRANHATLPMRIAALGGRLCAALHAGLADGASLPCRITALGRRLSAALYAGRTDWGGNVRLSTGCGIGATHHACGAELRPHRWMDGAALRRRATLPAGNAHAAAVPCGVAALCGRLCATLNAGRTD